MVIESCVCSASSGCDDEIDEKDRRSVGGSRRVLSGIWRPMVNESDAVG